MKTMTNWICNTRNLRIRYAPDDGGGTGGEGGTGESGTPAAAVTGESAASFDAATEAAKAVAATNVQTPSVDWGKIVPDELKDKPWMQDILKAENPTERFLKDFAGLQSKLGQRVEGIPKADAPKEEWDKFYNSMGRPETSDGYDIPKTEWPEELKSIGEFIDASQGNNESYMKALKDVAHELGIPKEKFSAAYNKLNTAMVEANKEFFTQAAQAKADADKEYAVKFTEKFKDKATAVQDNAHKILTAVLDKDAKDIVAGMSNDELVRLAWVLDGVQKKFIAEDVLSTSGNTQIGSESARKEAMALYADPAYTNPRDPRHKEIVNRALTLQGLPAYYKD